MGELRLARAFLLVFVLVLVVHRPTPAWAATGMFEHLRERIVYQWSLLKDKIFGAQPKSEHSNSAFKSPSPSYQSRANEQILREMFQVVLEREPKDGKVFLSFLDSLNQGASIEGIYNGFTHSSAYRDIESQAEVANQRALEVFLSELKQIQKTMKTPTLWQESSALPLSKPVDPGQPDEPAAVIEFKKRRSTQAKSGSTVQNLSKLFSQSSIYTLKRVLGEEALLALGEHSQSKTQIAEWYASQVVRLSQYGVDFGLDLRNKADPVFHREWALKSAQDRIVWEVLNRLHRLLNAAQQSSSESKKSVKVK